MDPDHHGTGSVITVRCEHVEVQAVLIGTQALVPQHCRDATGFGPRRCTEGGAGAHAIPRQRRLGSHEPALPDRRGGIGDSPELPDSFALDSLDLTLCCGDDHVVFPPGAHAIGRGPTAP